MTEDPNAPDSDLPATGNPQPDVPEAARPTRPQRPAVLVFTQAVLLLQAFVALFATLVLWSFARNDLVGAEWWVVLVGGLVLMLALFYASGKQSKNWARMLGWALQVPMLAAGLLEPAVAVMGVIFLILWIMALRLGTRIDRERKERDEAAQAGAAQTQADTDPA